MPAEIQSELARDQFIRAIYPRELRMQTQLAHPHTLQEALELAVEQKAVGAALEGKHTGIDHVVRDALGSPAPEKPAWATEMTGFIRAVLLQRLRCDTRPSRGPPVCWSCNQVGHISVRCPRRTTDQGNDLGSV